MKKPKVGSVAGILLAAAFFFAVAAIFLYLPDEDLSRSSSREDYCAYLDRRVPLLMKRYDIPGVSLALVRDGEIVWTRAFGYADRESGLKLTPEMPMRVQSISKSATAWAVMKLAEEGKLNLDDPVESYIQGWELPQSKYGTNGVTIRRLLSHTAGLPLGDVFAIYSPYDPIPSLEESLTHSAILCREPGTAFSYSNVGYNLLELLVEQVSGEDFSAYMTREVFAPLGMERSTFAWEESLAATVPKGYTLAGKEAPVYVYPEKASGGLFSTAEDIARFCIAGMPGFSEQKILTPAGVERLYFPQAGGLGVYGLAFDAYGLGYYIERLSGGETAVSHGGQGTGWMSQFYAVPGTGDAIVILTNSQRSWPFFACILHAWAKWRGFSSPGMTHILWGECALWALAGLILAAAVLRAVGFVVSVVRGRLRFTLISLDRKDLSRTVQLAASLSLLAGLWWCLFQRYLFLSAVFPTASVWLGVCTAVLAAVLCVTSFFHKTL